mmetsp:Transcript_30058/g.96357  ORF Transcript_30058/g.96357 Transcript_30058/m.96357 type:complete len:328 (+) Transcript_30058:68-1051(+)
MHRHIQAERALGFCYGRRSRLLFLPSSYSSGKGHGAGPRGTGGDLDGSGHHGGLVAEELLVARLHGSPGVPDHTVNPASGLDIDNLAAASLAGDLGGGAEVNGVHLAGDGHGAIAGALGVGEAVEDLGAIETLHLELGEVGGGEVGVEGGGEGELLLVGVGHSELRLELAVHQGDGLLGLEGGGPHGLGVVVLCEGHGDGGGGAAGRGSELPVAVAGEAVHLHVAGAELGEAVGDAAGDGLGLVELGVRADVQDVIAALGLPGGAHAAVEVALSNGAVGAGEGHHGEVALPRRHLDAVRIEGRDVGSDNSVELGDGGEGGLARRARN